MLRLLIAVVVGLTAPCTTAVAQGAITMTLPEAIEEARVRPASVKVAVQALNRATQEVALARSAFAPRLNADASVGLDYSSRPWLPDPPFRRLRTTQAILASALTLDWQMIDFGGRRAGVARAKAERRRTRAALAAQRGEAALTAAEVYLRALAAEQLHDDAEQILASRRETLRIVQRLVDAGSRPALDVARARLQAVAAQWDVEAQKVQVAASRAALAVAVGRAPTSPVRPVALDDDWLHGGDSLDQVIAQARERHPRMALAREAKRSAAAEARRLRAARWPTVTLSATGSVSNSDILTSQDDNGREVDVLAGTSYAGAARVGIGWAAFDLGAWRRAKVARESLSQARANERATEQELLREVAQAHFACQAALVRLSRAKELARGAQTATEAQRARLAKGIGTLLEVQDAEDLEQQARADRIAAQRDLALARATLMELIGTWAR